MKATHVLYIHKFFTNVYKHNPKTVKSSIHTKMQLNDMMALAMKATTVRCVVYT